MKKNSSKSTNKENQLNLGLKSPFSNKVFEVRDRVGKAFAYLEVMKFMKDPMNWFFITLTLFLIFMQSYFIFKTQGLLPTKLPLLPYFTNLEKKLADSLFIYALPALSLAISFSGIKISYNYFHKERIMSALLLLSTLLAVILITTLSLKLTLPFYE